MCFLVGEHIFTKDNVSCIGEHISLGICRGTYITKDMCFLVGEHISRRICVCCIGEHTSLGICVSS